MGIFLNEINSIQFVMFLCARNCQNVHKIEIKLSKQRILTGGHKNMNNLCIREFITIREFIIRRDHPKRCVEFFFCIFGRDLLSWRQFVRDWTISVDQNMKGRCVSE